MIRFRMIPPLALVLALYSNNISAQFVLTDPSKTVGIESRILLVEKEDFNCLDDLEKAFRNNWKLNQTIEFKSAEEIDQMLTPENSTNYLILTGDLRQEVRVVKGVMEMEDAFTLALYPAENGGRRNDLAVERHFVVKMSFPFCVSSEVELKLAANCMVKQIEQVSLMGDNSAKMQKPSVDDTRIKLLSEKTLLISQGMVDFSEEEAKAVYPYPMKFVSNEEIKLAIMNGSANNVIFDAVWSDKKFRWSLMVFDLQDYLPMVDSRFENMKSAPNPKSKFDESTQYLSVLKGKRKVEIATLKALSIEIKKASSK